MAIHQVKWVRMSILIILCATVLLTACVSEAENDDRDGDVALYADDVDLQAEKIRVWWDWLEFPYEELMGEYLKTAFGRERFEVNQFIGGIPLDNTGMTEGLYHKLRNEPTPDLIVFDSMYLSFFIESNYLEPMDIENFLVLDPNVLDELRTIAPDRQLYALPYGENVSGLFYNKTIFDTMKVPYPTDGMTWDEVIELASQVKSPGAWVSLYANDIGIVASQLSMELYNKETELVDFDTEAWAEWERFMDQYLSHRQGEVWSGSMSEFSGGKIAMIAGSMFHELQHGFQDKAAQLRLFEVDWDVVRFPVFDAEQPVAPGRNMLLLGVPRMAENKEDTYKLIRYLLSETVQFENMRRGLLSLREDADTRLEEFGSALWTGKSTTFIDRSIPVGLYDSALDKLTIDRFVGVGHYENDPTNWWVVWDQDRIRNRLMEYRGERATMILELQEKVREYERFQAR